MFLNFQWRSQYIYAGLVVIVTGVVIALALNGVFTEKEIASPFLAIIGTFLGALFAFRLNESKEKEKREGEQKAALNRALFVLARQHNAIKLLEKQLSSYVSLCQRAFNLPAFQLPPYSDLVHDFGDLAFLLETDNANVLMKLTIEQECFYQILENLRLRNSFYVSEVQPMLASRGLNGKSMAENELREALGERIFGGATMSASGLYTDVEKSALSIPAIHAELFRVAKSLFPKDRFIKFS